MCLDLFLIWPILEARTEIFQKFSFAFWEIWRPQKFPSEIIWPLADPYYLCTVNKGEAFDLSEQSTEYKEQSKS